MQNVLFYVFLYINIRGVENNRFYDALRCGRFGLDAVTEDNRL